MRFTSAASICTAVWLAAILPGPRAMADDSDIPGINRRSATFQRPMHENPEMAPYRTMAAPSPAPQVAAAPAPAQSPAPAAAPVATRLNVLRDADALIGQAEEALRTHDRQAATRDLDSAEMTLRNARDAGEAVPAQAMAPLGKARADLRRGRMAASVHEAEMARQIIASAE